MYYVKVLLPIILYLILFIFLRISIERVNLLKHPALQNIIPLIKGVLHSFIIITCLVFAFSAFGIDIRGVIAGLGLFSFAISFALKDAISNFISGLSILIYKPFKVNDVITIDGYSGRVLKMDIRYTILDSESELYLIPNAFIIGSKIALKKSSSES
ncbi:hypothetical protein IM40_04265 [Candidatus Paracaedimonas acanthamoebae]|nr:hypothetical protein IM40_04265 [Candidatus Paracaedimonas acanthamoebae]